MSIGQDLPVGLLRPMSLYRWIYFAAATTMGIISILQFILLAVHTMHIYDDRSAAQRYGYLLWGLPNNSKGYQYRSVGFSIVSPQYWVSLWQLAQEFFRHSTAFWAAFGVVQIGVHGVLLLRARLSVRIGHNMLHSLGSACPVRGLLHDRDPNRAIGVQRFYFLTFLCSLLLFWVVGVLEQRILLWESVGLFGQAQLQRVSHLAMAYTLYYRCVCYLLDVLSIVPITTSLPPWGSG